MRPFGGIFHVKSIAFQLYKPFKTYFSHIKLFWHKNEYKQQGANNINTKHTKFYLFH